MASISTSSLDIPVWQLMMHKNRCEMDMSSLSSDLNGKVHDLLKALKSHWLVVREISGITGREFRGRIEILEATYNLHFDKESTGPNPPGPAVVEVANAYGKLITAIIPKTENLGLAMYNIGRCREEYRVMDMESTNRRGWYRMVFQLLRAYFTAIATKQEFEITPLVLGGSLEVHRLDYQIPHWSDISRFLTTNYPISEFCDVSNSFGDLESRFNPYTFKKNYGHHETTSPNRIPSEELLATACWLGWLELQENVPMTDKLGCWSMCRSNPGRDDLGYKPTLVEIMQGTGLLPDDAALVERTKL